MTDPLAVFRGRFLLGFLFVWTVWLAGTPGVRADDPLLVTPPPKPVRIPAEFEPMQAVIVSPDDLFAEFLLSLTEDVNLILLWRNEGTYEFLQRILAEAGVDLDTCEFYQVSYTPVPRDGLPWFAFVDHNEPAFIYNQLSTNHWIPQYGLEQGYPVYRSGLDVQGGDFMTDGQGTSVSLTTGVSESLAELGDEFDDRVRDYWGVGVYHIISGENSSTSNYMHVDCLTKFLSPDTVMVPEVPVSDPHRERSEETAAYFRRQVSCYGTPYRVVRVDVPDEQPYINSLIVNHRVYVPIVGEEAADANALACYRAAMPGYEVIGVENDFFGETYWMSFFALHCHTMGIADEQMLYIAHTPVLDRPSSSEGFPISAKVVAHSQTELVEGTPVVLWRTVPDANASQADDEATWNTVAMARAPELGDHQYLAHIPTQPVGTTLQYYLQAKDASGRDETHPYIGSPQAHTFTVVSVGADVSAVSAARGGTIEIYMSAGTDNTQQAYRLTYSISRDSEELEDEVLALPGTTVATGFEGVLDDAGTGTAQMVVPGALDSDWVGRSLCFSLSPADSPEVVLGTVCVEILE